MKFYLLSDNKDTLVGFRLAGIEGIILHDREETLAALHKVMNDENIAIVLITTKLVNMIPKVISELKLKQARPLIIEIPDRHGDSNIGQVIDEYVSKAIGIKL